MGAELQNLFIRGGTPWAVKFYKERILSGLVADLSQREADGIDDPLCKAIRQAIQHTIDGVDDIEDGGFWTLNLFEKLTLFLDAYKLWNDADGKKARSVRLGKLRALKNDIFRDFYKYQNKLKKTDNKKRLEEFQSILEAELDIHASLCRPFRTLVEQNGELFPELKRTLAIFEKRSEKNN